MTRLAVSVCATALMAGVLVGCASSPSAGHKTPWSSTSAEKSRETEDLVPAASPTPPAPVEHRQLPESCDELFSSSMSATLTGQYGVTLNPEWSLLPDQVSLPTSDPALDAALIEQPML